MENASLKFAVDIAWDIVYSSLFDFTKKGLKNVELLLDMIYETRMTF